MHVKLSHFSNSKFLQRGWILINCCTKDQLLSLKRQEAHRIWKLKQEKGVLDTEDLENILRWKEHIDLFDVSVTRPKITTSSPDLPNPEVGGNSLAPIGDSRNGGVENPTWEDSRPALATPIPARQKTEMNHMSAPPRIRQCNPSWGTRKLLEDREEVTFRGNPWQQDNYPWHSRNKHKYMPHPDCPQRMEYPQHNCARLERMPPHPDSGDEFMERRPRQASARRDMLKITLPRNVYFDVIGNWETFKANFMSFIKAHDVHGNDLKKYFFRGWEGS